MTAGKHWLIDLHAHTLRHSIDSGLKPDDLGARVRELGLSAICVTEHNAMWSRTEAQELAERFEVPFLRGMEVSTDAGHILTFGIESYTLEMHAIERLREIVLAEGGVMVLAHPQRSPGFGRPWDQASQLLDGIECLNGDDYTRASDYLFGLSQRLGLPATGGSDAHSATAVGRCVTAFDVAVRTEQQLTNAIRAGALSPMLRDHAAQSPAFSHAEAYSRLPQA